MGAFGNESNHVSPVCHWMEANFFVEEGELIN